MRAGYSHRKILSCLILIFSWSFHLSSMYAATYSALNDAPVLANIEVAPITYNEGDGAVQITNAITVNDIDNTDLVFATISVSANYQSDQDVLAFTNAFGLTGSWNPVSGTLTLSGITSLINYQSALQTVTYTNTSANPLTSTRSVTFYVNDGTTNSNAQIRSITINAINNAPVLTDPSSSPVSFTENGGSVQVTNTIVVSDVDDTQLASANISITSGFQTAEDVLSYTSTGGISGSYNSSTGILALSGIATKANYQTTLRSVRYNNISENPSATSRIISFTVNDGTANSNIIIKTVTITPVNDAPVLANMEAAPLTYNENDGAVQITNSITVADVDNTTLASATITISANYQSNQDVLSITNAYGLATNWNTLTGQFTLTGTATLANYQAALRSVQYNNTSENPVITARTISFTVSDGTDPGNTVTRNVTVASVNDIPIIDNIPVTALNFIEDSPKVTIANTLTVTDVDNIRMASATVRITTNYDSSEDSLYFTDIYPNISASWNTPREILLTGPDTKANFQAALRTIQYKNRDTLNPSILTRTVTFVIRDSSNTASDTKTRNITITPVNDPPVATAVIFSPTTTPGLIGTVYTGSFTYTDPETNPQGTHIYKWYRATVIAGTDAQPIAGATTVTYTPVKADGGKYIGFEVTPKDNLGAAGAPVKSAFRYINAAPVATNAVVYAPVTIPGQTIRGRFTYSDAESNSRGHAIYQWYRRNDQTRNYSNPGTPIGTDSIYTLRSADAAKYIWFKVKPVATSGSTPGDSIWSNITVRIGEFNANISGTAVHCAGVTMSITLTVTGGVAPYTANLTRSGSTSNIDTTITGISVSPYVIQVKIPGSYVLTSLTDASTPVPDNAAVTADPVLLTIRPKSNASISGTTEICDDGTTRASLSLKFTSGTSPWTVTIRRRENPAYDTVFTNVMADPFTFNARVIGAAPTSHRVFSITDANGCPGDTASGSAWVSYKASSPMAIISGIDSICPGESATLIKVTLTTGTPDWGFTYLRNGANPVTIPKSISGNTYVLNVTNTGTYTLSGVSDQVCTGRVSGTGEVRAYAVPTALLSGTATICEHTSANLHVALTGKAPWRFSYKLGSDTTEVLNVLTSPTNVPVRKAGTYNLVAELYDRNCKGTTVSGSATISILPAPEVTISGLKPAYNVATIKVPVYGTPANGTFNYTQLPSLIKINDTTFFFPVAAGIGTFNVIYSYQSPQNSCYGYDTSVVRVLTAKATIDFDKNRTKYCTNDKPFTITGANIADATGIFSIEGGVGLEDHHDNTATVYPSLLGINQYTITYSYFDGTWLPITSDFDIGKKPRADFNWATECFQTGQPIALNSTPSSSTFGNIVDTLFFWKIYNSTGFAADTARNIIHTFAEPGNHRIELQMQNSYGCTDTVTKIFALRHTIPLKGNTYYEDFETRPIDWQSDSSTEVTVNSWKLGTPFKHGNPPKGFAGAKSPVECWYTDPLQVNPPREQSWVSSPCYDFTGTEKPMVKLWIWRLFNSNRDGANLQATADSGKTWINIGQIGDGVNWYNHYDIRGDLGKSKSHIGWSSNADGTGNDNKWVEARHSLDMLKGKTKVQFRVTYGSDGTAQGNDGIAFDNFWIGERNRVALIEHFTNSSDDSCVYADSVLNEFINKNGLNVIDLQYHTSSPPDDPFYQDNPVIPGARETYYGVPGAPFAILNGGSNSQYQYDFTKSDPLDTNAAIIESLLDSKFQININSFISGTTLNVVAQVTARQFIPATELSVRIAVIERKIVGKTGNNGETVFESVVKAMLPGAEGTSPVYQDWQETESRTIDQSWNLQDGNIYNYNELRVVAFIQNESTNEIYQAAIDTGIIITGIDPPVTESPTEKSFFVYPNPAERLTFIKFNQETREDITIELFNNLGRLVYTRFIPAGTDKTEIPVEDYPSGFYIFRLVSNNKLVGISKLIISK
jgi:hypothetical protein